MVHGGHKIHIRSSECNLVPEVLDLVAGFDFSCLVSNLKVSGLVPGFNFCSKVLGGLN